MNIKDTQNSARKKADDLKDKVKSADYEKEFNNIQSKVKKLDYKNPKNIIIIGFIIFFILIAGVFIFRDNSTSSNCKEGEICDFNGLNIKVDGVIGGMINSISGASVDLTVENTTDTNYALSYSDFSVIDNEDMSYKAVLPGYKDEFTSETISGKSKTSIRIYFDIADYDTLTAIRIIDSNSNSKDYKFDGKGIKESSKKKADDNWEKVLDNNEKEELLSDLNNSFNEKGVKYTLENLPNYDSEVINTVRMCNQGQVSKYILDGAQKAYDDGIEITIKLVDVLRDEESVLQEKSRKEEAEKQANKEITKESIVSSINYWSYYFENDRYYQLEDIPEYDQIVIKTVAKNTSEKLTKFLLDKVQAAYDNGENISEMRFDPLRSEESQLDNRKEVEAKMVKAGIDVETGLKKENSMGKGDLNFVCPEPGQCAT